MTELTPQVRQLLTMLETGGSIDVLDGDASPFSDTVMDQAIKMRFVRTDPGNFWSPLMTYSITAKGQRALGIDVPLTAWERFRGRFSRKVLSPT